MRGRCLNNILTLMYFLFAKMEDKIMDLLNDIEGISMADGLMYCGSDAAYLKFINSFYHSIDQKADDIESAYEKEDYDLYTMKVHSLKSTSRIAGMPALSELALELEEAGRAGDIAFIKGNNNQLLCLYRSYKDKLSILDKIKKEEYKKLKPISDDELKDAYSALKDSILAEDYDATEFILKEVMKYKLPENDRATMNQLENLLKNLEWDEMSKVVSFT